MVFYDDNGYIQEKENHLIMILNNMDLSIDRASKVYRIIRKKSHNQRL